jgi:hypothetical protein
MLRTGTHWPAVSSRSISRPVDYIFDKIRYTVSRVHLSEHKEAQKSATNGKEISAISFYVITI